MYTQSEATRGNEIGDLLSRAGAKERTKIEKHLAACDAEHDTGRARLWRRVATMLDSLSGAGVESAGGQAWRFFIADGKYKMQVFALEDRGDGMLRICVPDVIDEAVAKRILLKSKTAHEYGMKGSRESIHVEPLDSSKLSDPPAHVKSMLGWGRKAVEITLRTTDNATSQLEAVEQLCALAARKWVKG